MAEAALDAGEAEAISLALEMTAVSVILDDLQARGLAKDLGLAVVGTAGVLFAAKQRGLITYRASAAVFTQSRSLEEPLQGRP